MDFASLTRLKDKNVFTCLGSIINKNGGTDAYVRFMIVRAAFLKISKTTQKYYDNKTVQHQY